MKKNILIIGLSLLAAIFLLTVTSGDRLLAVSGCCKERKSYKGKWFKNNMSFAGCKKQNSQDGDDVFDKSGLIWWDMKCVDR